MGESQLTQVFFVPPSIIIDYLDSKDEEGIESFRNLLDGSIGINIKKSVLEEFSEGMKMVFDDFETAYEMAVSSFPRLQKLVVEYSNESFFDRMNFQISQVATANFRYSMQILLDLLHMINMSLTQIESLKSIPSPKLPKHMEFDINEFVLSFSDEMPDAVSPESVDLEEPPVRSMLLLSFNFMIFLTLVITVAVLTEKEVKITEDQKDQIESLLRDWSQEIKTQLVIISTSSRAYEPKVSLEGIIADEEDRAIVEEGFIVQNDHPE